MKKQNRIRAGTLKILGRLFTKQKPVKPWAFVLLSIAFSQILTALLNSIQSFPWFGKLSPQLLIIGTVDALVVPLIVAPIIILFINYASDLNALNGQLQQEITERRQAETALAQSEEKYKTLVNAVAESSFLMSTDGSILIANETVASRLGRSVKELIGSCIYNFFPTDIARSRKEKAREVITTGNPAHFEDECWGRHLDNSVYPVRNLQGNVETLAILGIDITERKLAEAKREQLILDHLDALSRVKTLSGLLTICASCKKIRDDEGRWHQLEVYISEHADTIFSHGICPECVKKLYSELGKIEEEEEDKKNDEAEE